MIDRNNNFSLFLPFFFDIFLVQFLFDILCKLIYLPLMFYEQTQTYRTDTLKFNMERDLSFKSKEKCLYFYGFSCKMLFIFIHIFSHSLKKILWDSSILCYYTILYTNISWWWMIGLFGFMVLLLLVAVSRNFLILLLSLFLWDLYRTKKIQAFFFILIVVDSK